MTGYQAMLGFKMGIAFSELRLGRDYTSFKAPGLGLNELNQWELWWLFGLTYKE